MTLFFILLFYNLSETKLSDFAIKLNYNWLKTNYVYSSHFIINIIRLEENYSKKSAQKTY